MDTTVSKRVLRLQRHVAGAGAGAGAGASGVGGAAAETLTRASTASHVAHHSRETRTIEAERANATFGVRQMTYLLDGGAEMTAMKEKVMRELEEEDIFRRHDKHDLTRQEVRKLTLERVRTIWRMFYSDGGNLNMRTARLEICGLFDPSWYTRNGVHFGLFMGSVMGQGNSEQAEEWVPRCMMLEIFGCMAMTELGHGSFVRGLETTATYHPESKSFDLHSPTVTSTKWWIGAAGQTATHSAVYARLIVNGEDKGIHVFVVQIRDLETSKPMRGVSLGDCGAKMGRDGIDNGWIRFDHVRIPREQMMMKHAQVSEDGVYTKPPRAELAYGALMSGRSSMVKDSGDWLKLATTIAIRYASVRRQGEPLAPGLEEPVILDYSSLQSRLMPILAATYAFIFTGRYMMNLQARLDEDMDTGEMSILQDVHATSAGLKSYCTWYTLHSIETLRHSLGGHGYSKYSGLSAMYADFAVQCTWEGDNYVMALQTARYLVSSMRAVRAGKTVSGSVSYLEATFPEAWPATTTDDVRSSDNQLLALRFMAAQLVKKAVAELDAAKARGATDKQAWNETGESLFIASRAHCVYNIATFFVDGVADAGKAEASNADVASYRLGPTLKTLCDLYILQYMREHMGHLMMGGFINTTQAELVEKEAKLACRQVRKIAVPLVDAFNYSDFLINSPMGRRDGDVYPHYFEMVKQAPHATGVAPYFLSTIKPMLEGEDLSIIASRYTEEDDSDDE